jgi:hypothetical protein
MRRSRGRSQFYKTFSFNKLARSWTFTAAVLALCISVPAGSAQTTGISSQGETWRFAVSGDSRNCGDVVMPAIARSIHQAGASFYWHLGDLRALYDFDEDMMAERYKQQMTNPNLKPLQVLEYQSKAWPDFIAKQVDPFATTPFFLGIGNHEIVPPKTRKDFVIQFADWLDSEPLHGQRLSDDSSDHQLHTYYHWIMDGIDFLYLDNASELEFDDAQLGWATSLLAKDAVSTAIRAVVVGMHEALPESLARGHSMSDFPQEQASGLQLYAKLLEIQNRGKKVYVFASHSHFYLQNIFDTPFWRAHGGVLPGWIIGTAGAQRYELPDGVQPSDGAKRDTYGYLLVTVHRAKGAEPLTTEFVEIQKQDIPTAIRARYTDKFVDWCFENNSLTHPETSTPW